MNNDDLFAHARRSDPDTSRLAAEAISPHLTSLQRRVRDYAHAKGPRGFCDLQMAEELGDNGSTLRTRRAELAGAHIILDTGHRRTWGDSKRKRIVWVHRAHHPNPPPLIEPEARDKPTPDEIRSAAMALAVLGMGLGDYLVIDNAVAILRRLAR